MTMVPFVPDREWYDREMHTAAVGALASLTDGAKPIPRLPVPNCWCAPCRAATRVRDYYWEPEDYFEYVARLRILHRELDHLLETEPVVVSIAVQLWLDVWDGSIEALITTARALSR